MDYRLFTNELFKILGLDRNIFDFDLSPKKLSENDIQIKVTDKVEIRSPIVKEYQYKVNDEQKWECITLFIPLREKEVFIEVLNTVLEKYNLTIIDVKPESEFEYNFQGLAFITGKETHNCFQVEVAKFKI